MRQVWKFPLAATWQDIARVEMPKGAQVVRLAVQENQSTLWAIVDPEQPTETRDFKVFGTGHDLPPACGYVGTYESGPFVWHLFELFDADLPDDLPDDQARADYRLLLAEGYTPVGRMDVCKAAWKAPADVPAGAMSLDAMQAVARLQEHGYGPVVE